jgi:hypothetical protein
MAEQAEMTARKDAETAARAQQVQHEVRALHREVLKQRQRVASQQPHERGRSGHPSLSSSLPILTVPPQLREQT